MQSNTLISRLLILILLALTSFPLFAQESPLRLAIIGLDHGHVEGVLWNAMNRDDIQLVGIYDPRYDLFQKYKDKYNLDPDIFYANLAQMLDETKPQAASVMTPIARHLDVVRICAPKGVHTLLEKPLAYDLDEAQEIAALAKQYAVHVLTNFETSWYASVRHSKQLIESGEAGTPTRFVFRHGHNGPIEIGCADEFVDWLTDPAFNGGGAVVDFGCYGANIMTWLMHNQRPTSVFATTNHIKPVLYPDVDDDATIVLTYPSVTAVIQASWSWTHDNKEMDIHATNMSIHAAKWDALQTRLSNEPYIEVPPDHKPDHLRDEWTYLRMLVHGKCQVDPLSSLENNLIVAEILDAAIESSRTGERVNLRP